MCAYVYKFAVRVGTWRAKQYSAIARELSVILLFAVYV